MATTAIFVQAIAASRLANALSNFIYEPVQRAACLIESFTGLSIVSVNHHITYRNLHTARNVFVEWP